MNHTHISRVALLFMVLTLNACQKDLTDIELVQRAKDFQDKGELISATIDLKNAAAKNPENPEARWLLGKLHVELGNGESGEKELRKAVQLGIDFRSVVIPLGKAIYMQGKYQNVLDEIKVESNDAPSVKARILTIKADALRDMGQLDFAQKEYRKAIELDTEYVGSYVGLSRLYLRQGNGEQAQNILDQAKSIDSKHKDVLLMEGDLHYFLGQYEESQNSYKTVLETDSNHLLARLGLSLSLLAKKEVEEAVKHLDKLLQKDPHHLYTNYLRGLAAFELKDYGSAKKYTEQVLNRDGKHFPSLLVAGATNFALKEYEQAVSRLERVVAVAPNYEFARRLLGETHRRLGNDRLALEILKPLATREIDDASLLAGIGRLASITGKIEEANEYFLRAAQIDPENAQIRALLGLSKLSLGTLDEGLSDLAVAAEMEPGSDEPKILLIQNLLKAKKYEEALVKAIELQELSPNESAGYIYSGIAHMKMGDIAASENSYRKALDIDPNSEEAALNLGVLLARKNEDNEAKSVLERALQKNPDSRLILYALVRKEANLGNSDATEKYLKLLTEKYPDDNLAFLLLSRFYLVINKPLKAERILEPMLVKFPDELALLEVLARSRLAAGKTDEAIEVLTVMARSAPQVSSTYYWLGLAYKNKGDVSSAIESFRKAILISPGYVDASIELANVLLRQGKRQDAETIYLNLKQDSTNDTAVSILSGRLAMSKGEFKNAIAIFSKVYDTEPTEKTAIALASAHIRIDQKKEGEKILNDWLEQVPESREVLFQLAAYYKAERRFDNSIALYGRLLNIDENNWVYHNEIAMIGFENGNLDKAYQHAEIAYKLSPKNPLVIDTYGLAMLNQGNNSRALRLFERANQLLPGNPEIQLHLAQSLIRNHEPRAAIHILEGIKLPGLQQALREQIREAIDEGKYKLNATTEQG